MHHRPRTFSLILLILSLLLTGQVLAAPGDGSTGNPPAKRPAGASAYSSAPRDLDPFHMDHSTSMADPLTVYLVTLSPGDAAYERFGHNMLHIINARTGQHASFNFGVFDFDQENFYWNFIQGRMVYQLGAIDGNFILNGYISEDRTITLQELNLTPQQKADLQEMLWENAKDANKNYRYDYFRDNCSTRLRDALNTITAGQLQKQFDTTATSPSYRWQTLRLTRQDLPLFVTLDTLLGQSTDKPLTVWQEMFLPEKLMESIADMQITRPGGSRVPLVKSTRLLNITHRAPEPTEPPFWTPYFLLAGLILGGAMGLLTRMGFRTGRRLLLKISALLGIAWSLVAGIFGLIITWAWFTDHVAGQWNQNWLVTNPLSLILIVAFPLCLLRRGKAPATITGRKGSAASSAEPPVSARRHDKTLILALLVLIFSVLALVAGVLPIPDQSNGLLIALAIPAHAGLFYSIWVARSSQARSGRN